MDRFRKKVERDLAKINSNEDEEGTSGSGKEFTISACTGQWCYPNRIICKCHDCMVKMAKKYAGCGHEIVCNKNCKTCISIEDKYADYNPTFDIYIQFTKFPIEHFKTTSRGTWASDVKHGYKFLIGFFAKMTDSLYSKFEESVLSIRLVPLEIRGKYSYEMVIFFKTLFYANKIMSIMRNKNIEGKEKRTLTLLRKCEIEFAHGSDDGIETTLELVENDLTSLTSSSEDDEEVDEEELSSSDAVEDEESIISPWDSSDEEEEESISPWDSTDEEEEESLPVDNEAISEAAVQSEKENDPIGIVTMKPPSGTGIAAGKGIKSEAAGQLDEQNEDIEFVGSDEKVKKVSKAQF